MTEPLEPGTIVRSAMASQSIWVKTNAGGVWIDRYTGDVRGPGTNVPMSDAEVLAPSASEFWVQTWDGRRIRQWDRVDGQPTDDADEQPE